jgi:hypothetical protein
MRLLGRIATATLAIAACVGAAAGSAQAAPRGAVPNAITPTPTMSQVKVPMTLEGFDPTIAKRDGYTIRKNAEGKQYAVKLDAKGQEIASTVVAAASTCGSGYIEYDPIGNKKAYVFSGWDLNAGYSAIYFTWFIATVDSDGVGNKEFDGTPASQQGTPTSWYIPEGWLTTHSVTGSSYAEVTSGQILLANSGVCDAPLPIIDYATLY